MHCRRTVCHRRMSVDSQRDSERFCFCALALCHENTYPAPDYSGIVCAMHPHHAACGIDEVFSLSAVWRLGMRNPCVLSTYDL